MNLLLLLLISMRVACEPPKKLLDLETLRELNDFEIRLLKDFVRGRGRGSVSKLPIDDLFKEDSEFEEAKDIALFDLQPTDGDVVNIGGPQFTEFPTSAFPQQVAESDTSQMFVINSGPPTKSTPRLPKPKPRTGKPLNPGLQPSHATRIIPKSGTVVHHNGADEATDDKETFKEFAVLLQQLIDIRKGVTATPRSMTTTTTSPTTTTPWKAKTMRDRNSVYPSAVKRIRIEKTDKVSLSPTTSSNIRKSQPKWQEMRQEEFLRAREEVLSARIFCLTGVHDPRPHATGLHTLKKTGKVAGVRSLYWMASHTLLRHCMERNVPFVTMPIFAASFSIDSEENSGDWEKKMHELSEQLHTLLMQIKETKKNRPPTQTVQKMRPKVTVVRNGSAEQTPDNQYRFVATVTLIQDGGKNILVDTGLGTDINARTQLMRRLSELHLVPPSIDIVVVTHGHPDHAGNTADFPDATHYMGWYVHRQNVFNLSRLFEAERQPLTENVYLMKTPGHTSEDISVFVKDAEIYGNVAVTGDVFMRMEDTDHPMMWRPLSFNETQQSVSRRYILCTTDFIIPGHGPGFRVPQSMKRKFVC